MVAITARPVQINRLAPYIRQLGFALALAAIVAVLAQRGQWLLAVLVVLVAETRPWAAGGSWAGLWARTRERLPELVMGASAALVIAMLPLAISQLIVAGLYAGWRFWHAGLPAGQSLRLASALAVQAVAFEAFFLAAAIWHWPKPLVMVLVWGAAYVVSWHVLTERKERGAGIMAAAWALVAAEASWVFLTWLVSYVPSKYAIVPQPALVLAALAYCFGNIYSAQRQGALSRSRLTEYLLIGLILIALVIAGTGWRGSL